MCAHVCVSRTDMDHLKRLPNLTIFSSLPISKPNVDTSTEKLTVQKNKKTILVNGRYDD